MTNDRLTTNPSIGEILNRKRKQFTTIILEDIYYTHTHVHYIGIS